MKVTRLPVDPGPAGWNAILPMADPAAPVSGPISADWLIIGAGFAGLSAALRLSYTQPGDRIVVLDAVRIGDGPAGRNSGFMIDLPHDLASDNYSGALEEDRRQIAVNRAAIDFALAAASSFGLHDEAIARVGKINAAATMRGARHIETYSHHLSALGEPHEIHDAQTMREITGTSFYAKGLFTPDAALLQPALYIRGLATGLRSRGVAVHDTSPVTGLTQVAGLWRAQTPGGTVTARRVILAVNGHAESFGFYKRRLAHVLTYASMTRALSTDETARLGGQDCWAVTPADPMGTTVRRISGQGGHRIVIRNRFTYDPGMEVDDTRLRAVARDHDRSFAARFPNLGSVGMEYRWGGRLCLSRNDTSAFGEIEDGLFAACCQNGLGVAKGTVAGIAAADLATGNPSHFRDYQCARPDPAKLPPESISWIGATIMLKWGERRAGREL